jgi:hypothetical protein
MERIGWRDFEERVGEYFGEKLGREFAEIKCQVGPDQEHKFDLVSSDGNIVIECKSYTWTDGGNFPQAKVSTANEALLFLSRVNADRKILVMQDDVNSDGKSLVSSYVERYDGLMDDVEVWRYLPRSDDDDIAEQARVDKDVYEPQEIMPTQYPDPPNGDVKQTSSGKYAPMYEELMRSNSDTVRFSFEELNRILDDPLPDSAYRYRVWWNPNGHSHAEGWESIGWTVSSLDLSNERVEFVKKHKE